MMEEVMTRRVLYIAVMMVLVGSPVFAQSALETIGLTYRTTDASEGGILEITVSLDKATMKPKRVDLKTGYETVFGIVEINTNGGSLFITNKTVKGSDVIEAYYYKYSSADGLVQRIDANGNVTGQANANEKAYVLKIVEMFLDVERNSESLIRLNTLASRFM